ncbi:MAG: ATP-binding protein [Robiginitalea sp.]|uniref:sensor histidine kinase n=1 Tax=Robiginitalea sp. TaxID=1902411 RepID=UPI003C76583E
MSKKPDKGSGKEKGASTQTPVQRVNRPGEPMDKLSELQETLRLRERALEIEAALERVRVRSMDMRSSEDLSDVLSVLFQQFDRLGIDPLTVWLTLWNPEENTFTYRSTGISGKRIQGQQVVDIQGMDIWKDLYDKWKSGASEDVEVLFYAKENLEQLFTLMAETFESMPKAERLTAAHFPEGGYSVQGHCKFGYIGYNHTEEPTQEERDILRRFSMEFGRVYQHFLDLKKAEAQAREAQIEAALERVRSKTMAMHSTKELLEVVVVLFNQLKTLEVDFIQAWISIWHLDEGYFEMWLSPIAGHGDEPIYHQQPSAEFEDTSVKSWLNGDRFSYVSLPGEDIVTGFLVHMDQMLGGHYFEQLQKKNRYDRLEFVDANHTYGTVSMSRNTEIPEDDREILYRFAQVFEQTYTRFLDLQKAEAQVREAQIEAALERVRSKTMAMHNSQDVGDTVITLFNEVINLGLDKTIRCGIGILEGYEGMETWSANSDQKGDINLKMGMLNMTIHPMLIGLKKAWENGENGYSYNFIGEDVTRYYTALNNEPQYPFNVDLKTLPDNHFANVFFFTEGILFAFTHHPLSEEAKSVLHRFANVFGQTYRRYLDLQKAEAQAREAQVEASLERVRSKTMAMHNSQDVSDTVIALFEEVVGLGLDTSIRCGIGIHHDNNRMETWSVKSDLKGIVDLKMGMLNMGVHPMLIEITKAKEKGVKRFYHELIGEDVTRYYRALNKEPEYPLKVNLKTLPDRQYNNVFFFRDGVLFAFTHNPLTEEAHRVLERFASVFGQTYRRYLDLQKAEAQAREARIEAALEKVRSRSLAMHSTDELNDVLCVLFEQFDLLGINPVLTHLTLFDEDNDTFSLRITTSPENKVIAEQIIDVKAVENWKASFENWKNGDTGTVDCIHYTPDALPALWEVLHEVMDALPEAYQIQPADFPDGLYTTQGHCKYGYLGFNHSRRATEGEKKIVTRFASEFGRLYQRFLDLQTAEKQARESEIQLALERVRARTMAMHRSEELSEVAVVLFEQIENLGDTPERLNIGIVQEEEGIIEFWSTEQGGQQINRLFRGSIEEPTTLAKVYSAWKAGKKSVEIDQTGEDLQRWIYHLEEVIGLPFNKKLKRDRRVHSAVFFKHGMLLVSTPEPIPESSFNLLGRFGKVFEQTYTRFIDLKKAEAQAREAEIQLSLERIRARAMAMQESSELTEVLSVIFQQLRTLGVETVWTHLTLLHLEENAFTYRMTGRNGKRIMAEEKIALDASEHWAHISDSIKSPDTEPDPITRFEVPAEGLDTIWELFDGIFSKLPKGEKVSPRDFPNGLYTTQAYCEFGFLGINQTREANPEEADILLRFTTEFSRLYQRFLDLQNAEKRAQEAQIEAALERIRARAMAMQHTEELNEVIGLLCEQYDFLGINPVCAHLSLIDLENNRFSLRLSGKKGARNVGEKIIDLDAMEEWKETVDRWKKSIPQSHQCLVYPKESVTQLFQVMDELVQSMPKNYRVGPKDFPNGLYSCEGQNKFGYLGFNHSRPPTEEEIAIVIRFAREFERIYQRFLDLEKAEAQAREAEIEASLERVRAASMAMHNSAELFIVINILSAQLNLLGVQMDAAMINEKVEGSKDWYMWLAIPSESLESYTRMEQVRIPYIRSAAFDRIYRSIAEGKSRFSDQLTKPQKDLIFKHYFKNSNHRDVPKARQDYIFSCPGLSRTTILSKNSSIQFYRYNLQPFREEENRILERFGRAFEQSYTRFLDLQRAEAQAREAQIEAALERVRAKTMAMHNTEDIAEMVTTFFNELLSLGIGISTRCGIGILNPTEVMQVWTASVMDKGDITLHSGSLDMKSHPMLKRLQKTWSEGESLFEYTLKGREKLSYFKVINDAPEYPVKVALDKLPVSVWHNSFIFPNGTLFVFSESPIKEEIRDIFIRFSSVFSHSYTRYLDLERAEKQARESKIEAALERVRAKAMAMHSSEDLRQTISTIFEELKNLNIRTLRLGLGLLYKDKPEGEIVTARIGDNDEIIEVSGTFKLAGHPVLEGVYTHFKEQRDYFPILQDDEIGSYYAALTNAVDVQGLGTDSEHYGCFLFFNEGGLYAWASRPHSEEQVSILKKFCRVVEITYRRYKDLIESEAREKEAVKQASLDRVRAEIASMRTTKDLERITPLVWKELTTLGIPFFRCGVFIMDETHQMVHVYLTTPEGKALGAMNLPFDFDMSLIQKGVDHWRRQKILVEEWNQAQFVEMTQKLMEQGQVKSAKSYQAGEKPPERLVLHQVPFAQGMLYVGNTEPLTGTEIDVVKALTRTFAVAYARYEDFKELEKAKKKVENTLDDLQAAQSQLIQSEKMASLGELTAGIAHEIKNPLNFVNNFSEVSRELLEELMEEMEKGDLEEVKALTEDLVQNLEKIVHHGKRADSIVKGMLQHSRSSDGHREPTDLNALTDEYVRLAYHGLRAKDKSFNATVNTHFDPGLGTLDVVPQDIGRVILNLLTNAFYAVNEKSLRGTSSENGKYEPTVTIQTKREKDHLEILVSDNGDGMPKKVLEKIFQPFFTTKPTGQGTGLGLSLSYDIVKAHGGELKVETTQGEGTTFSMNFKTETT